MPRKLKTFTTSLGFFELAVAAPSMKAALEAWGSKSNLFHQGLAKEARGSRNHRRNDGQAWRRSEARGRIE